MNIKTLVVLLEKLEEIAVSNTSVAEQAEKWLRTDSTTYTIAEIEQFVKAHYTG